MSRAMFLRAVATEQTTLSLSIRSSSTRMGSPFSLRTAARMYAANWIKKRDEIFIKVSVSHGSSDGLEMCMLTSVTSSVKLWLMQKDELLNQFISAEKTALFHIYGRKAWESLDLCSDEFTFALYLPVASWQVLKRTCRAFKSGRVGALRQQSQVRPNHRGVPQHLCPFRRLGEAGDGPHTVPLNTQTAKMVNGLYSYSALSSPKDPLSASCCIQSFT